MSILEVQQSEICSDLTHLHLGQLLQQSSQKIHPSVCVCVCVRGREELRRERGKKERRKVNSYLLSFCCDIQIWSCEATLLVDNVYLRETSAVISLIYTRPLTQLNMLIKLIYVQVNKCIVMKLAHFKT